MVKTLTS